MQVALAYLFVVLVWSTTPLAIHFSNSTLSFVTAITVRMLLAYICCALLLKILRQPLISERSDWLVYAASALGLFPNMLLIYWAAQYIPSGLMSVIMGVYPFFVGLFSYFLLKENPFTLAKFFALALAVVGLAIVHQEQVALGQGGVYGVIAMIIVCVFWGISSVLVKKFGSNIGPLRLGTGSIAFALPFFIVAWFFMDGEIPQVVDNKSLYSVLYLVVIGSVISHTLWFYVLRECSVTQVSLVTLITPILAITWGALFADEKLTINTILGVSVIVISLSLYQGLFQKAWKQLRAFRYAKAAIVPEAGIEVVVVKDYV